MNIDQYDAFGLGKSVDEIQIEKAKELLEIRGYSIVCDSESAKKVAIGYGYKVSDPLFVSDKLTTLKDMRNYFFMRLWAKYPGRQQYYVPNWNFELRMVRLFVESREKNGLNRFNAIQECAALVDVIFDNVEEFNFKGPIDIRILGQDKAGWITQKASVLLNNKLNKYRERKLEETLLSIESEYKIDLAVEASKLDSLISKMEVVDG